jgi:hypothetical protein
MTTRLAASQYPLFPGLNVPCALLCSSSDGTNEVWSLGRVMKAMPMNSSVKDFHTEMRINLGRPEGEELALQLWIDIFKTDN